MRELSQDAEPRDESYVGDRLEEDHGRQSRRDERVKAASG